MICEKCGADLIDANLPCPECGHLMPAKADDVDKMISDILEEDRKPTFEEVPKDTDMTDAKAISKVFGNEKPSGETKVARPKPIESGRNGKKTSRPIGGQKNPKTNGKSNGKPIGKSNGKPIGKSNGKPISKSNGKTNGTGTVTPLSSKRTDKAKTGQRSLGDTAVMVLRYGLALVIVLFTISLFFNWFTLKGNAVNHGVVRTEEVEAFLYPGVANYSVEQMDAAISASDSDPLPIISFSGMDLYNFGRNAAEPYKTVKSISGTDTTSIVSVIHTYYMQAVILMVIVSVVSVAITLIFPSLKGISIVRNLSVINLFVMGLNYLSLRFTYFSMFAVKAKDLIKQADSTLTVTTESTGIAANDVFYQYLFFDERGFRVAIVLMVIWLFIGIVLTEVKHRKDEIAIEQGEIQK